MIEVQQIHGGGKLITTLINFDNVTTITEIPNADQWVISLVNRETVKISKKDADKFRAKPKTNTDIS